MRLLSKIVLLVCGVVGVASIAGVAASWAFADEEVEAYTQSMGVEMGVFMWAGAEELPDDVQGEDHRELITQLVDGEHGLNTPNSEINNQVESRQESFWSWDTFGSMDVYDKATMTEMFGLDTSQLSFMLYFPDDSPNTRYIFTTSVDLGATGWGSATPNVPIGDMVYAVYRTTLEKDENGEWKETVSELGYAESAYYKNNILGSLVAKCPSFDVETWKAGKRGTSTSDAIYSYVGLSSHAYLDTKEEVTYYKLKPTAKGTRKIVSTNVNCTIEVLNANGKVLATSEVITAADGTQTVEVSWTGSANTQYYFTLTGARSIDFTIS